MRGTQCLFLVPLTAAAVWLDLKKERIPNWLIVSGLALGWCVQLIENGVLGIFWFSGGAGFMLLAGAPVYYFRMMGAGDIKLLAVAGGFLGPWEAVIFLGVSLMAGGCFAVYLLWKRRNLKERVCYFYCYVKKWKATGKWQPYLNDKDQNGRMHFSIAVLIGILLYAGGVY